MSCAKSCDVFKFLICFISFWTDIRNVNGYFHGIFLTFNGSCRYVHVDSGNIRNRTKLNVMPHPKAGDIFAKKITHQRLQIFTKFGTVCFAQDYTGPGKPNVTDFDASLYKFLSVISSSI